jgi:hypothetical protein
MARRKREPMRNGKKNIIIALLQEYDIIPEVSFLF